MEKSVKQIIEKYGTAQTRLMDILIDTQELLGFIGKESVNEIALEPKTY